MRRDCAERPAKPTGGEELQMETCWNSSSERSNGDFTFRKYTMRYRDVNLIAAMRIAQS